MQQALQQSTFASVIRPFASHLLLPVLLVAGCSPPSGIGTVASQFSAAFQALKQQVVPALSRPLVLDVVLDGSPGSPGGDKTLARPSMVSVAGFLAAMPGSTVRFWAIGDDASSTRMLMTVAITPPAVPGRSAAQAHQVKLRALLLSTFDALTIPVPKRSPLVSSVVRVTQETTPPNTNHFVLLFSDLLEHSELGDLECDDPTPAWPARLRSARLFLPGSLRGVTIIAAQSGLRPVAHYRCPATIAHHDRVLALWTTTVQGAGATFVPLTGDVAEITFQHVSSQEAK